VLYARFLELADVKKEVEDSDLKAMALKFQEAVTTN